MQLLKYGLKDGKLVHINDVANGLSCGCVCPSCGGKLEAHQGKNNQYHFKHYNVKDCNYGSESALHIIAKNIIFNNKCVRVPNPPLNVYDPYPPKGCIYIFEKAYMEKVISPDLRCDVLLEKVVYTDLRYVNLSKKEPDILNVEIRVTHKVDFDKRLRLYNENLKTIEIDLSDFVNDIDENKIKNIITSGEKTELIFSPNYREIYAKRLLGNFEKINYDRSGNQYLKKCRCANPDEKTYLLSSCNTYNTCSYSSKKEICGKQFLCIGFYGDLDYRNIDKIVQVKRKNNIVQHAELVVNGETKTFLKNSSCPYFSKCKPEQNPRIGMKILHRDYGESSIIDIDNRPDKTIIRVQYSNGETSSMTWQILLANNMIKIL